MPKHEKQDVEIWKMIPGHGKYEVSNRGRVRSSVHKKSKILIPYRNKINGYYYVSLGRKHYYRVHTLVCMTYNGPKPDGKECAHKDGNKENNCDWNLMWATRRENMAHAKIHGTTLKGEKNPNAFLTEKQVREILKTFSGRKGEISELARQYGVRQPAMSRIIRGKRWKYLNE